MPQTAHSQLLEKCQVFPSDKLEIRALINLKAVCCFTTRSPSNNWHLLLNIHQPWRLMLHCINICDRLLTLILVLKWYISAKWKFPSPPCLQGNGVENDRLYAIILLENQRSIRESVKSWFNDVKRFLRGGKEMLHGVWDWRADGLGYVRSVACCLMQRNCSWSLKSVRVNF